MPVPVALTSAHLLDALVPAGADPTAANPEPYLTSVIGRIDHHLAVTEIWAERAEVLPQPPRRETLAELVQTARRELRGERARVAVEDLQARRFVLQQVRAVLVR